MLFSFLTSTLIAINFALTLCWLHPTGSDKLGYCLHLLKEFNSFNFFSNTLFILERVVQLPSIYIFSVYFDLWVPVSFHDSLGRCMVQFLFCLTCWGCFIAYNVINPGEGSTYIRNKSIFSVCGMKGSVWCSLVWISPVASLLSFYLIDLSI